MSMRDRGNTDRTKDKKISYLGGIPVRLVLVGRSRCKLLTSVPQRLTTGSKMLISGRTGTGVESGAIRDRKFGDLRESQGDRQRDLPQRISLLDIFVLLLHCTPKLLHVRVSLLSPAEQKQRNKDLSDLRRWSVLGLTWTHRVQAEAFWDSAGPI